MGTQLLRRSLRLVYFVAWGSEKQLKKYLTKNTRVHLLISNYVKDTGQQQLFLETGKEKVFTKYQVP